MKKILFFIAATAALVSAAETCNVNGSYPAIPQGACVQSGYVCNLAFDVDAEQKVMAFHLGSDSTCQTLLNTKFVTVNIDNTTMTLLRVFFIEGEEYHTDALGMTLAGSLALSASNNKVPVSVIYHQVGTSEYGGVLLQSISQVGN